MPAARKAQPSIGKRVGVMAIGIIVPLVLLAVIYVLWIWYTAATAVARTDGTLAGLGVRAPVQILRDARDVPHIRAASIHDAMFAEGYVTGSDRLFQLDITRRFVLGRLSEMFGSPALAADERARTLDVKAIAAAEFAHLPPADRDALVAYADGVNAAATHEPTPPEFHALFLSFEPWTPEDSLAVGFATVLTLTDSWDDVTMRDAVERDAGARATDAFFSLTDPRYDVPTAGGRPVALPSLPPLDGAKPPPVAVAWDGHNAQGAIGSNAWTAGAAHTSTGRALLANDPHLDRTVPGTWQLVDLSAPGLHVAGATFAGVPGVVLGHNERIAWGATNGYTVSPRVYTEQFLTVDGAEYRTGATHATAATRVETFNVRAGGPHERTYYTTRHGFVLEAAGIERSAVQWIFSSDTRSPISAFLALDRAASLEDALRALAAYPGPTQNFVLAAADGRAAYTLAGAIPSDSAWGLRAFDGPSTVPAAQQFLPTSMLPHVAPGRDTLVVTANNLPYGAGYPYRLGADFAPPYRAAEIGRKLRSQGTIGVESSRVAQADTMSIPDAELARMCVVALHQSGADRDPDVAPAYAALVAFDGHMDPDSRGATVAQRVRVVAARDLIEMHLSPHVVKPYLQRGPLFTTLMRALREHPRGWFPHDDVDAFLVAEVRSAIKLYGGSDAFVTPYGDAYAVAVEHPFASFGFHGWDAPSLVGRGGNFAPAAQGPVSGQSFRAVWDVGNWDAGGIDIPIGESGEPGSPHYHDLADAYAHHVLTPLPFSAAAVARATQATLVLNP